jgi:DDE superfamily endonuclease
MEKLYTVLVCANADASQVLPPFVVNNAKHLYSSWGTDGPMGASYSESASGLMETKHFQNCIEIQFILHKRSVHGDNPVIFFLDGHGSHLSYQVS